MIGRAEIEGAVAVHGRVVAAVVAEAKGSSPRDSGAMVLVFEGGTTGTIGGGTVEHTVIGEAQKLLQADGPPRDLSFPLGPDLDQCCGGHMRVQIGLVAPVGDRIWPDGPYFPEDAEKRLVIIYGAGHVGQALVRALSPLPFRITLVDTRDTPPAAGDVVVTPLPEAVAEEAPTDAFHLVLTHSHAVDLEIVTAVLSKGFGFCGLIGSATKRALFERRLAERGVPEETIAQLACPIGLPGLRDKRPEVIAASVAVQLLVRDAVLRDAA
ncbi:MAG: xanthine dehydrogenase accessory protein XdhC [Pseudomonadota bacterium]